MCFSDIISYINITIVLKMRMLIMLNILNQQKLRQPFIEKIVFNFVLLKCKKWHPRIFK